MIFRIVGQTWDNRELRSGTVARGKNVTPIFIVSVRFSLSLDVRTRALDRTKPLPLRTRHCICIDNIRS